MHDENGSYLTSKQAYEVSQAYLETKQKEEKAWEIIIKMIKKKMMVKKLLF